MSTSMNAFCFTQNQRDEVRFLQETGEVTGSIPSTNYGNGKQENMVLINQEHDTIRDDNFNPNEWVIRGLTPREAERLQGFPDDWTKEPYRGKPADLCPDTPRYKACGNSMTVPVIRYLGERISMVEDEVVELMLEGVY